MGALGGSGPCGRAEAFYYDFLRDRAGADIPASVIDHIEECDHCRKRIERLEETLSEAEGNGQSQQRCEDNELIAEFGQHFAYLDGRVACRDVKSLLPGLLALSSKIRILTPISGHVDRCPQCARDLKALSALELKPEQLHRLKRLYAADFVGDSAMCRKAQSKIAAFGAGMFEEIDSDVLDHFCMCPNCRKEVYEYRNGLRSRDERDCPVTEELPCSGATMADMFDLVVPYGLSKGQSEADRACRAHIRSCPECLEMMQLLHHRVYGIAERADSEVATVYSMDDLHEGLDDPITASEQDLAIGEKIPPLAPEPVVVVSGVKAAAERGILSHPMIKPYVKVAFLAAAMIPLAILIDMTVPLALGLNVKQVNQTVAKAANIHVSVYVSGQRSASAEYWWARERGIAVEEIGARRTVYDLAARRKVTVPERGPVEFAALSQDDLRRVKRFVASQLEISFEDCPAGAELSLVPPEPGEGSSGSGVYELTWPSYSYDGPPVPSKLWISIDSVNRRPEEITFSRQRSPEDITALGLTPIEDGYVPELTKRFKYPSEAEIIQRAEPLLSLESSQF